MHTTTEGFAAFGRSVPSHCLLRHRLGDNLYPAGPVPLPVAEGGHASVVVSSPSQTRQVLPLEGLSTPGQGQGEGPDDSKSERSEDDDGVGRGRSERSERSPSRGSTCQVCRVNEKGPLVSGPCACG